MKRPVGHEPVVEISIKYSVCHLSGNEATEEKLTLKSLEMEISLILDLVSVAVTSQVYSM